MRHILVLILTLVLSFPAWAEDIHSITNLNLTTEPTTPVQAEAVESLKLNFDITSSDGLDGSRFRLSINDIVQSLNGAEFEFNNKNTNQNQGTETANAVITSSSQIFNKVSNNLKLEYLLAEDSEVVRTEASLENIKATPTDNIDDQGNSLSSQIINIRLEDSLDSLQASSAQRFIRITAVHDKRVVPEISFENFNAVTNPIIKNLVIEKKQNKQKSIITNEFTIELEKESLELNENLIQTVFKTNDFQILEKQKLFFSVNLISFYKGTKLNLGNDIDAFDQEILKYTAQETSFESASLSSDLSFNAVATDKKNKLNLESNEVNIAVKFKSDNNLVLKEINTITFSTKKKKGGQKKPKIIADKAIKVSVNDTKAISLDENQNIIIPAKIIFTAKRKKLEKKGFLAETGSKRLKIPMKIIAKDENNVDVILEGEVIVETAMVFNLPAQ
jgi:hypothetical protein